LTKNKIKICLKCGQIKHYDNIYRLPNGKLTRVCKKCSKRIPKQSHCLYTCNSMKCEKCKWKISKIMKKFCISCLLIKPYLDFNKSTDRVCKQCKSEMKAAGI